MPLAVTVTVPVSSLASTRAPVPAAVSVPWLAALPSASRLLFVPLAVAVILEEL